MREMKEREFERSMLEIEEMAHQILARVKELRRWFSAFIDGDATEIDVRDVARELEGEIKQLHTSYGDLKEWLIKEILEG